jgi:ribose transport system substrate-binding protein
MTRRQALGVGLATTVVVAAGCGALSALASATVKASPAKVTPKIAFFGYSSANAYTQAALTGVKQALKSSGGSVHFYDSNTSSTTQVSQIEDAVASGQYNGFVVYSDDGNAVVPAVKQAIAHKIKVSADFVPIGPSIDTTVSQVPGLVGSSVVPIDQTGTDAGNLIVQACKGIKSCQVAYMPGDNTLPLEIDRTNHVMAVLKKYKNIKVVATVQGGYTSSTGEAATQNVLTAHPKVNVIAASGDQAIVGSALALTSKKLLGKVKLIGGGGTYQAIKGIKAGTWFGSVNYCPTSEAALATKMVVNALQGKPVGKTAVNSLTICGAPQDLTKKTVGSYKGEWSAG